MYFEILRARLVANLRARIRNGELTERRLALSAGISQPHIHNVLKGARILSPEMGDKIMRTLGISVLDLLEPDELPAQPVPRPPAAVAAVPPAREAPGPEALAALVRQAHALHEHAVRALERVQFMGGAGLAHVPERKPAARAERELPSQRRRDFATSS